MSLHSWRSTPIDGGKPLSPCSPHYSDSFDHARGRMSLLKTLEIRAPPNNPQNADRMRWTSDVFEIAPSLAHIRTSASICPTLQWDSTQLQSLHGNISATEDVPDALTAALALMRHRSEWAFFSLRIADHASALSGDIAPVVSRIKKFEVLTKARGDLLERLLSQVTLPSLTTLGLSAPWTKFPASAFLSFVSRSSLSSVLQTLSLKIDGTADDLLRCLASLGSLRSLWLCDLDNGSDALITDELLHGINSRDLVPSLDVLELTAKLRFQDQSLIDLATLGRWQGANPAPPLQERSQHR
ncbi:hypothetical protein B0H14DRAFT_3140120 [Mycena olivaceomarginata]|nr:hypothetical protein B0H14DRAFT_3140120 [Mycena olivaceomarginata]